VRSVSAGLLYLSQIALARWMGAYDYGVYVLVWTWVLVLGNLSNLGLSAAVVRLVPQHRARGEDAALRGLFFAGRLLVVAVASGIALIGFGVLWCLGKQVASPYLVPALLGLICLPILTLIDIQDGMARAHGLMALGLLPPYVLRPLLLLGVLAAAQAAALPVTAQRHWRGHPREFGRGDRAEPSPAPSPPARSAAGTAPLCAGALAEDGTALLANRGL